MKLAKMAMMLPMLALASTVAQAGAKCTAATTVDATNRWARGALGTIRNTSDTVSNIYCIAYSWDTSGTCTYMVVENESCLDPKSH